MCMQPEASVSVQHVSVTALCLYVQHAPGGGASADVTAWPEFHNGVATGEHASQVSDVPLAGSSRAASPLQGTLSGTKASLSQKQGWRSAVHSLLNSAH